MEDGSLVNQFPPGFRFCPTDEELVLHFLYPKSSLLPCCPNIIPDLHLHPLHPWELHGKALLSGKRYFFFSQTMENRVLENGYWKQLDFEEPIFSAGSEKKIGVKKHYEFFIGEAPLGVKTNWLMQEYHLCNWGSGSALSSHYVYKTKVDCRWVVCKVEEKKGNAQSFSYSDEDGSELSCLDEMFLSLDDDVEDISSPNSSFEYN
ncbi:Arabidopsis NAC domain containing protein 104, xylem NAC domain 1 [Hibiscus trionum]|uniref:Arabidopsis NAC domain containing protein 104, xylem NAC domain 1 n=1 Tax=Hibiscus trionum TaxID=183268 RepID=A0A9W7GYE8_HIBTR|nr:Arabidopsis NAC domain containing protein 104, xylem NAC domain 1 [Hibiscus trionum]